LNRTSTTRRARSYCGAVSPSLRLRALAQLLALPLATSAPLLGTACGAPKGLSADDHRAIAALLDDQRRAWNDGDLDAFMVAYEPTEELVFTSGAVVRRGWETTRTRYRERYGADRETMGALEFELIEIQELGADGAIVLGRWTLLDTPEAGDGIFSLGLRRGPLGWRIVHDHTSASAKITDDPS